MKKRFIFPVVYLLLCSASYAQSFIQHVEPASWWVGMKNPKVQLLIHGQGVKNADISINYPGVQITQTASLTSPNYVFVDLLIDPAAAAGEVPLRLTTTDGRTETIRFPLLQRRVGSASRQGFTNADVIYLITPDRFANGNPQNDATADTAEKPDRSNQDGRHGGDIQGMIDHLDYIEKMGFTAIWPMPLQANNQARYSYHGYAISDFYHIDPRYGSNELYRKLSDKAAERNIKLVQDIILNHCGIAHWWMSDLPSEDWINFKGNFSPTNHRRQVHQDPHVSEYDKKQQADGWFVPSMPDLNQRNPFMANYLIQNSLWWIEYANLGGLRVDTYPYSDKTFLTNWSKRMLDEYPNINIVGEEWSLNPAITSYWQRGKKNHDGYISYLPSVFDFPTQNALVQALNGNDAIYNQGLVQLYESLANDFLYPDSDNLVVFGDNHDMSRFFTQLNEDPALLKMGLAYLLTTRGIPQIYYGTEVLLRNPLSDGHGEIRADMPGGWSGDAKSAFTGTGLSTQEKGIQDYVKQLLNWRKATPAVHAGKLIHFAPENGVYVYFRILNNDIVMVAMNKNKEVVSLQLDRYDEVLNGRRNAADVMSHETAISAGKLTVPPMSVKIVTF